MLTTTTTFLIDGKKLRGATRIEINRSVSDVVYGGKVTVPSRLVKKDPELLLKLNRGLSAYVSLGYNGTENEELRGYVTGIEQGQDESTIELRSRLWKLEGIRRSQIWRNTHVSEICREILDEAGEGMELDIKDDPEVPIYVRQNQSGLDVLESLKEEHRLWIYEHDGQLRIMKWNSANLNARYSANRRVNYAPWRNMQREENHLRLKLATYSPRKQMIYGHDTEGRKIEYKNHDGAAEEGEIYEYEGPATLDLLKSMVRHDSLYNREISLEGDFRAWLWPAAHCGDTLALTLEPCKKEYAYSLVKGTETVYSIEGSHRRIYVGKTAKEIHG